MNTLKECLSRILDWLKQLALTSLAKKEVSEQFGEHSKPERARACRRGAQIIPDSWRSSETFFLPEAICCINTYFCKDNRGEKCPSLHRLATGKQMENATVFSLAPVLFWERSLHEHHEQLQCWRKHEVRSGPPALQPGSSLPSTEPSLPDAGQTMCWWSVSSHPGTAEAWQQS